MHNEKKYVCDKCKKEYDTLYKHGKKWLCEKCLDKIEKEEKQEEKINE
jgi:ribosomal protein L37AE/L43A